MVADDLEAVGIPTELRPLPLEEYEAFVVSGDQELFSFGWIGAYRSPGRVPGAAVRRVGQRQPHQLPVEPGGRPARGGPRQHRRRQNTERWALAERLVLRPTWSSRSPSSAPKPWSRAVSQGLQHAVDGTVDWTAGEPRALTLGGWPPLRGPCTVTSPQGRPRGPRRSGGIGRRASLRGWCPQGRGGSSPPSDTNRCSINVPT